MLLNRSASLTTTVIAIVITFLNAEVNANTARFRLRAHSLTAPKHFDKLVVDAYHIPPGLGFYASELVPQTRDNGFIGYLNGTQSELKSRQGSYVRTDPSVTDLAQVFVISEESTPPGRCATAFPIGSYGSGTKGIYIENSLLKYNKPGSQGWYACNTTIHNGFFDIDIGPFVRLFWKPAGFHLPDKCEHVKLCVEYVKAS